MSSNTWKDLIVVPVFVTGINALINYSLGLPQEFLIKDLAISGSVALGSELVFNYGVDHFVENSDGSEGFGGQFINTIGKPLSYSTLAHIARMYIQKEYNKNLLYATMENSIIYMAGDYLSIPFSNVL